MEDYLLSIVLTTVVFIIIYVILKYFSSSSLSGGGSSLVSTIQDGKTESTYSGNIQVSQNQQKGLVFSYTAWILIDDFNYKYGEPKIVFTKGTPDLKISCPALVIDPNTNSLLVYIDTYGTKEIIPISNIPAKKWLHIGITVDQYSSNIYINGTLHTHHTLNQLPKQNSANVIITPKGGFNGKVGSVDYYPTLLDQNDIYNLSLNTPKLDTSSIGVVPPYFAQTWWLQKP